jgi:hypothetical protein
MDMEFKGRIADKDAQACGIWSGVGNFCGYLMMK